MFRLLILLLCTVAASPAEAAPRKIAFARGDALYVANLDGGGLKKVTTGAWPNISPDGKLLAFNTEDPTGKTADRRIAIADIATGKVTVFANIPSNNCHNPVWSPDGTQLLFQIFSEKNWHIALVSADGANFRYVKKADPANRSYYSMVWSQEGKSFYCQDLDAIYHVGLDGAVNERWEVAKLFPSGGLSSAARLSVSPNDGVLLVDVEMDEEVTRPDWEGPPPAIWSIDLASGRPMRLSPKGLFAWQPCWVTADVFFCVVQSASAKEPSIYRVSADGKSRQPLLKNARDPSVSR